jgi:hypothetical protein
VSDFVPDTTDTLKAQRGQDLSARPDAKKQAKRGRSLKHPLIEAPDFVMFM